MNKNIVIQSYRPRIGVGIPCHINDLSMLKKYCLPKVMSLNPAPAVIVVNINDGKEGMKKIRTELYDYLFTKCNCDIVFNLGADMIVSKDALKYANPSIITSYGSIYRNRPISTVIALITRLTMCFLRKRPWRGTYSIPRKIWFEQVRDSEIFNEADSTVKLAVKSKFESVLFPKTMILREHQKVINQTILYHPLDFGKSRLTKLFLLMQRTPF